MNWEVRIMKSATSFFNATLFKKNLTRYWPIWVLYTVIWLYALPMRCIMTVTRHRIWSDHTPAQLIADFAEGIPDLLEGFGIGMAFVFGILAAMAVFSYLYNHRAATMIHTLPVRREGLFLTSYLSGLAFLLAPNVLVWLLTLGAEALCGGVAGLYTISLWLAGQSGMCLFFYSFAVFCAMFTGNLLALPAFYGIFNFLAALFMLLFDVIFEPFLYGYAGMTSNTENVVWWLTPVVRLADKLRWRIMDGSDLYHLEGATELAVYALVGLAFAALALPIYRKRHIESAGDVVAIPILRPVFKCGVALCSGLCFGYWLHAMFGLNIPFGLTGSLLLWTAIGYFAAEMLLKKSFRVWNAWKGCAAILALMAVGLFCLHTDAFGFVDRIPAANSVVSVTVEGMGSYPHDEGRNFDFTTENPRLIEKTIALHQGFVSQRKTSYTGDHEYIRLNVTYTLSNGATLRRHYGGNLWPDSPLAQAARDFYCDPEVAELAYDPEQIEPTRLTDLEVSRLWDPARLENDYFALSERIPPAQQQAALQAVYDAVMADFLAGNLGKRYLFDREEGRLLNTCATSLSLYWNTPPSKENYYNVTHSFTVTLTPQAEHTLAALRELGILGPDTTLQLYGEIVDEEERAKLLYNYMGHDPQELTSITIEPDAATGIIGGADGTTSIIVADAS